MYCDVLWLCELYDCSIMCVCRRVYVHKYVCMPVHAVTCTPTLRGAFLSADISRCQLRLALLPGAWLQSRLA